MLKTENLVILLTDIAGFTEATSLHSREQNQRMLDRHNSILLPIVKRFQGRHIKSIGDALLLAFTSPTDGMRCAMAMQDAIHEYNQTAPKDEEIHIRIAASLGEVRVTKGDIFGEPVNVTSRIEGIAPEDEIYFSEAVYLAMNKAEVPAVEIGVRELKGISKPVRIFAIPRFVQNHLVPDPSAAQPEDPRFGYPFGGMHLSAAALANINSQRQSALPTNPWVWAFAATAVCLVGLATFVAMRRHESPSPAPVASAAPAQAPAATIAPAAPSATPTADSNAAAAPPAAAAAAAAPAPAVATTAAVVLDTPAPPAAAPAAAPAVAPTKKPAAFMNMAQVKAAYRAARISKQRYRELMQQLESDMDMYIRRAKIDYREGRISKETYRRRVADLELRYEGRD